MRKVEALLFPDLEYFQDYNGNFQNYFQAIYKIFESGFIKQQPFFKGQIVKVKKYPLVDGIHKTFYHITHEGDDESNRTPDFRRMERMRYPKFVIENNEHQDILIWKNKRGRDERIVLFNEEENYIVILAERGDAFLFITAYCIESNHRKRKLIKEYETYKNTKTA